jgi:hypothetical protein
MADFLSRVQQLQMDNSLGLNGSGFGNSFQMPTGMNAANSDIWTQAAALESRYKTQLQVAATVDPMATAKVMNDFMNEAMDLLFSSLNSPTTSTSQTSLIPSSTHSSQKNPSSVDIPPDPALPGTTAPDNNDNKSTVDDTGAKTETAPSGAKSDSDGTTADSSKPATADSSKPATADSSKPATADSSKPATADSSSSDASKTKAEDTKAKTEVPSDEKKVSAKVKSYQELMMNDMSSYTNSQRTIKKVMEDDTLTMDEKLTLLSSHKDYMKKAGFSRSIYYDRQLADMIYSKLNMDDTFKASDAIKMLRQLNENCYDSQKIPYITAQANKGTPLTTLLYEKALKEGVLNEAMEVAPPFESIQGRLSFGKETEEIRGLFDTLNNTVNEKTGGDIAKYGLTPERATELDKKFDEMTAKYSRYAQTNQDCLQKTVFPQIFETNNYNANERMYLLQKVFKTVGLGVNRGGFTMKEFTDAFRDMSNKNQEKYFPEILKTFANFKAR